MSWISLLDIVYPIGSIYWSATTTSPASIVGGTWSQFTETYLKCDTNPGYTGGTLNHTHTLSANGGACIDIGPNSGTTAMIVAHTPGSIYFTPKYKRYWYSDKIGNASENFETTVALTGNTDTTGLQPPFTVVCAWKRIA